MKAFDVIKQNPQERKLQSIKPQGQYFSFQQKEEIRIPINKKIEINAISHQLKKPKVHLIKPKQPPIHIINSRVNYVLGLDTQKQTWSTGAIQRQPSQGFFHNIARGFNRDRIEQHRNIIQNQQNPNYEQQHHYRNPFHTLKNYFDNSRHAPNTIQTNQMLLPSQNNPSNAFQMHANAMYQQQNQKKNVDLMILKNKITQSLMIPQNKQSNIVQSQVKQINLTDLPQRENENQDGNQQHEDGIGAKISRFFDSIVNKFRKNKTFEQQEQKQGHSQNKSLSEKDSSIYKNKNIQESQVIKYQRPNNMLASSAKKMVIEQSIVESYVQKK